MALPYTRNTNYAADDPVKSADLNDLQDQIIAINNQLPGRRRRVMQEWRMPTLSVTTDPCGGGMPDWRSIQTGTTEAAAQSGNDLSLDASSAAEYVRVFEKFQRVNPDVNNSIWAIESIVRLSDAVANVDVAIGFHTDLTGTITSLEDVSPLIDVTSHSHVALIKRDGVTNWEADIGSFNQGTRDTQDLGVAAAVDTDFHVRIVHQGQNTPLGETNGRIDFYLDEVLVHSFVDNVGAHALPDTTDTGGGWYMFATVFGLAANAVVLRMSPAMIEWYDRLEDVPAAGYVPL